jgi:nucleoside-diphosphate-sugar epimerase
MRALITGATGFIGTALAKRLSGDGEFEVYGLVRFVSQGRKLLNNNNVEYVVGDLTDYYSIEKVVKQVRPEVVVHLGALTPVSESYDQPITYTETNYIGTIHLLEALRRHGREQVRVVVVAGTTEMFDTDGDIDGYNEFKPESPYAVSKVASVLYAEYAHRAYGLPIVVAIPTNTYGRAIVNQRHYFIEKVITELLMGKKELYLGNPGAVRDWLFREDHVDVYVSIIKSVLDGRDGVVGRRFAFGTGVGYTTRETAELIKELINPEATLHWWSHYRPAETSRIVISKEAIARAREALGWYPRYDLQSGIKQAINEWREVLGA